VNNQRQTKQKTIILDTIQSAGEPLTADQILSKARLVMPAMALTTVYRNLELLTTQRVITRLIYPDGITRYKQAEAPHHHQLICLDCARKVNISQCPLECLARQIESETGFEIVSHQLDLYGYCDRCKSKHSN